AEIDYSLQLDNEATHSVLVHIEHKNCPAAVSALNKGIANRQRAILLMAGSMYEQGLCLKQDWDQAAQYYQLAHEAGNRDALPRLIAGYAEKNRDPAAALWWLAQSKRTVSAACASANELVKDPDAFVAALNSWPKGQIAACTYAAGVLMRISGETEFPGGAHEGVSGDAVMNFVPATGTITWTQGDTDRITVSRLMTPGSSEHTVFKDRFLSHMTTISERTLKQFVRPEGIDPAWTIKLTMHFYFD
ncbi:MAG: hypothetical protein ACJ8GW_06290, partial [Massilia sp.]